MTFWIWGKNAIDLDLLEKCECTIQSEQLAKYYNVGIPNKYIGMTWEDFVYKIPKNIYTYIKKIDYWINQGVGLYFHGPNGSGKTFLLAQMAKYISNSGYKVKFFKLDKIVSATIKDDQEFLTQVREADVICIDEITKISKKRTQDSLMSFSEVLYDTLLRDGSNEHQVVFCTSNISLDELEEIHGKHIKSLFNEMVIPTEVKNPDFRKKISNQYRQEFELNAEKEEAFEEETKED